MIWNQRYWVLGLPFLALEAAREYAREMSLLLGRVEVETSYHERPHLSQPWQHRRILWEVWEGGR
jgi:hypothetical protein